MMRLAKSIMFYHKANLIFILIHLPHLYLECYTYGHSMCWNVLSFNHWWLLGMHLLGKLCICKVSNMQNPTEILKVPATSVMTLQVTNGNTELCPPLHCAPPEHPASFGLVQNDPASRRP